MYSCRSRSRLPVVDHGGSVGCLSSGCHRISLCHNIYEASSPNRSNYSMTAFCIDCDRLQLKITLKE